MKVIKTIIEYFTIRECESMKGKFIAFNRDAYTKFLVRIRIPVLIWWKYSLEGGDFTRGPHVLSFYFSFRINKRNKIFLKIGYYFKNMNRYCQFISEEQIYDMDLTPLIRKNPKLAWEAKEILELQKNGINATQ